MIDTLVSDALRQRGDPVPEAASDLRDTVLAMVERVELHKHQIVITFASATADDAVLKLPWASRHSKLERTIHDPAVTANSDGGNQRRDRLVQAIARARCWLDDLIAGRVDDIDAIAVRQGKSARNIRMMIQLAFLDPTLIERAIDGRLPAPIGATEIVRDLPMIWSEQRQMLGV